MAGLGRLFSFLRSGGPQAPRARHFKHSQHITVANPWHAVSIVTSNPGCPICGSHKGIRYLAREAPQLPLAACPTPQKCHSVYKHFSDRRAGPRRSGERRAFQPMNLAVTRVVRDDRRSSRGRRQTDG